VLRDLKTVFVAASYPFFVDIRDSLPFFRDWGKVTGMTKHCTARTDLGLGLVCAFPAAKFLCRCGRCGVSSDP